ncbi:hypothetical protein JF50_20265 [Pseudoalteromonas luteoviolacea]|uniref:MATE family efflux transporter n=1 Tax=Pseudoalteromonas luteoviolacea TaxID=43657 RepID=A0A0C1MM54_9GAMM|nr:MATE family efflux transporter [Pseudoalteromonas luteoviolacea]KID55543.1 hypothetical protein JF50_20265 [Pseudoalteromonas luteoviolacea]
MSQLDFTSPNYKKVLLTMSVPMILLAALDYVAIYVDMFWLMTLTDLTQLPATFKIAGSVVAVIESVFIGCLSVFYIYANQAYGRKDNSATNLFIQVGFTSVCVIAILVAVSGDFLAHKLSMMFGASPLIVDQASSYLSFYFYGYVLGLTYTYSALLVKMTGDLSLIIKFRVLAFIVNILCTPGFIFLALHFDYGVIECAIFSTLFSRLIAMIYIWRQVNTRDYGFKFGFSLRFRQAVSDLRAFLKLSMSETISGVSLTLSMLLIVFILSYFDNGVLEAVTITNYVTGLIFALFMSVIGIVVPFSAQNAGAGNYDLIEKGVHWMVRWVLLIGVAIAAVYWFIFPYLAQSISSSEAVWEMSILYNQITIFPWFLMVASFPYILGIVGLGDSKGITFTTVWSMYLCNVLPLLVVMFFVEQNIMYVAISDVFAHVMTFVGCYGYFIYRMRKLVAAEQTTQPELASAAA